MSLGEKLKDLRREKGWSQDEFAFHAQIDGRQVSRYENDRVVPSVEVLVKIAKAYDVSLDFLVLDDAPRRSLSPTTSPVADRLQELSALSADDEQCLLHLLDALEAKNRLKEIAAHLE